jgi:SAM-dependent methyltransferase
MSSFEHISLADVRAFWDSRPCNVRHSSAEQGSDLYFAQVRMRRYFVEDHIEAFADFERWQGTRVLEIGTGIGSDAVRFVQAGASVLAVDVSPVSLTLARRHAESANAQVDFCECSAEDLQGLPRDFDLVYSFGVLHHTPHPWSALREIYQHLKPGGILKLMLYHRRTPKVWAMYFRDPRTLWDSTRIAMYSEAKTDCPVTYTYTRHAARQLVASCGFVVDRVNVDHIFPYRVADYIAGRYVVSAAYRWMPLAWFRWLETHFGWHLLIEAHRPGDG